MWILWINKSLHSRASFYSKFFGCTYKCTMLGRYNIVIVSFVNILLNEFFWTKKKLYFPFSLHSTSSLKEMKTQHGFECFRVSGHAINLYSDFLSLFFFQFCVLNSVKSWGMKKNKDILFWYSFKERLNVTFPVRLKIMYCYLSWILCYQMEVTVPNYLTLALL